MIPIADPDVARAIIGDSRAHDISFPAGVRHGDRLHLAGQAEGMVALGRLSLDGTKLGGVRDRDYPQLQIAGFVNQYDSVPETPSLLA
jgi:hypothetical protein